MSSMGHEDPASSSGILTKLYTLAATMTDIDEDRHVTAPDPGDIDLTDETQDFRFLTSLSR